MAKAEGLLKISNENGRPFGSLGSLREGMGLKSERTGSVQLRSRPSVVGEKALVGTRKRE